MVHLPAIQPFFFFSLALLAKDSVYVGQESGAQDEPMGTNGVNNLEPMERTY